jgi:NAD(P)-dependent dehydrogenase (short-subunit alcohol dehydrogenase family)
METRAADRPLAVVCGSDSLTGSAVAARLTALGWNIAAIDGAGAAFHPNAIFAVHGNLHDQALWAAFQVDLDAMGRRPHAFIYAADSALGQPESVLRGAELGCQHLVPLLSAGDAVVMLTSVLGTWDVRADMALFGATNAGLLGLMRGQALLAAPNGVRVNAVCAGLVADPSINIRADILARIPLGKPAAPDDIADAALFLLSPDARHITGSTLVVDGGQSLQSWSNAPREGTHRAPSPPATDRRARSGVIPNEVRNLGSEPPHPALTPDPAPIAKGEGGIRCFQDRVVLITGAAGGLGSAAARRFASEGAKLALLDQDGRATEQLADELTSHDGEALALHVNVADEESIAKAITCVEQHFSRLDVLFNNAGVGGGNVSIAEMPPDEWDRVIAINLRGVFLGCKYGVPAIARSRGGAIVNMGSSTGRHDTITGGAAYMASKAAVEAMTKSLALQVAPLGIRANTICPGIIQTQLSFRQQERGDEDRFFAEFAARIPLGRVGQPEDVAAAVAFLASDQARHITGASLLIDGGQTLRKWINAPDLPPETPIAEGVIPNAVRNLGATRDGVEDDEIPRLSE